MMLPSITHLGNSTRREADAPGSRPVEWLPPYMSYNGYPLLGVDLSAGEPSLCD